jgi:dTDP-glucose pyrophosphorylase
MSNTWEKILISPDLSIRATLSVIDKAALRSAIVVDDKKRLLGLVSDGDIRRGLLSGVSLDDKVRAIMNPKPTVGSLEHTEEQLNELILSKGVLSIPITDNGILVGFHTLHDNLSRPKIDNPVFLMAGGFGTRLKPLTDNCPKPLLKVGDKPILEITLLSFIKFGFVNFYISTHYMSQMIQDYFGNGSKWGVRISYVHEEIPLGTGGALGLLPNDLSELPLIIMNGDILTNIDFKKLLDFHSKKFADATICVREYEYQIPYGVIQSANGKITSMLEKPIQYFHINTGIYVVNSEIIKGVKANKKIDMPTLLEQILDMKGNVMMFHVHEYWLDIGHLADYKKAQVDIKTLNLGI